MTILLTFEIIVILPVKSTLETYLITGIKIRRITVFRNSITESSVMFRKPRYLIYVIAAFVAFPVCGYAQGTVYDVKGFKVSGRMRMNFFKHFRKGDEKDYSESKLASISKDGKMYDPKAIGIGLRLKVETPLINGFGAGTEFFSTDPYGMLSEYDVRSASSGKDTFYRVRDADGNKTDDYEGIYVLGQAYLRYSYGNLNLKAGRFIFNTPLTSENDVKMIPNTFQGYAAAYELQRTTLTFGYLTRQKLRDRKEFHSLIRYGTSDADMDDSGAHRSLTGEALAEHDINSAHLVVTGLKSQVNERFTVESFNYYMRKLFNTTTYEMNYRFDEKNGVVVTPGFRFMLQQDLGAGKIGGAFRGDPGTREEGDDASSMITAFRIVLDYKASTFRWSYSQVEDRGDIIAPWRGFPNSGYTRTMAEYNWNAGIKSYLFLYQFDLGKADIIQKMTFTASLLKNMRKGPANDTITLYAGVMYWPSFLPKTLLRTRFVYNNGWAEANYLDARFELRRYF